MARMCHASEVKAAAQMTRYERVQAQDDKNTSSGSDDQRICSVGIFSKYVVRDVELCSSESGVWAVCC